MISQIPIRGFSKLIGLSIRIASAIFNWTNCGGNCDRTWTITCASVQLSLPKKSLGQARWRHLEVAKVALSNYYNNPTIRRRPRATESPQNSADIPPLFSGFRRREHVILSVCVGCDPLVSAMPPCRSVPEWSRASRFGLKLQARCPR